MKLLHLLDLLEAKPNAGFYQKEIDTWSCLQQAGEFWLASASDKPAENGSIRPRHWFLLVEAASLPACHGGWGEQGSQDNTTDWRQFITLGCWPHGWWGKPLSFLLHRTFNNLCVTLQCWEQLVCESVRMCVCLCLGGGILYLSAKPFLDEDSVLGSPLDSWVKSGLSLTGEWMRTAGEFCVSWPGLAGVGSGWEVWPPSLGIDTLFGNTILMTQAHSLWKMAI